MKVINPDYVQEEENEKENEAAAEEAEKLRLE